MGSAAEPYTEAALDTLSGAALASVIAGNNTSADELAAQMLGSVIGTAIAQPAVKGITEYKKGQEEVAAERRAQLQMEAPSPDLTTDQLTNYYNQNQDQYMTGGNTSSSAAANSTSQSSLNAGASAPRNSIGASRNSMWSEAKSFVAGMGSSVASTLSIMANDVDDLATGNYFGFVKSAVQSDLNMPNNVKKAWNTFEQGNSNTRAFMLGELSGGLVVGAAAGGVGFAGDLGLFGGEAVEVGGGSEWYSGPLTAEQANFLPLKEGMSAPYAAGTRARDIILQNSRAFVRLHGDENQVGVWLTREDEIAGLTPEEIQDKFALPSLPTYVSDAHVPSGAPLRVGKVAGVEGWGAGGGMQYESLLTPEPSWFLNMRLINEYEPNIYNQGFRAGNKW